MKIPMSERLLAALPHLGYLPVAFAIGLALADHRLAPWVLAFGLIWTVVSLMAFRWEPGSPFLREHIREARRYHSGGAVTLISLIAFFTYVAIFTWGAGAVVAFFVLPVVLMAWVVPTWAAAYDAVRGREHHYEVWSHQNLLRMFSGREAAPEA